MIDGGIGDIAGQAIEQSSMLKQLNIAIGELDQATQSNAAVAEQSTAACQSLAEAAARLDAMVAEFKLRSEAPASTMTTRSPAARLAAAA